MQYHKDQYAVTHIFYAILQGLICSITETNMQYHRDQYAATHTFHAVLQGLICGTAYLLCSTTKSNLQYHMRCYIWCRMQCCIWCCMQCRIWCRMQCQIWCRMQCHKFLLRHCKKQFCDSARLFCSSTGVFMQYCIGFHAALHRFLCSAAYLYCGVAPRILVQHCMWYWRMQYHLKYTF